MSIIFELLYAPVPFRDRIPRSGCYRADAGFMVHIKPDCRCSR